MNHVIVARQLTKTYAGKHAVDSLNLSVARGSAFGLLGANGAGKSTTIECITGTKTPDSGSVSILDLNVTKERKQLFQKVSVQFQEANYQEKIKVSELCEVTGSLYKAPSCYSGLLREFGIADKTGSLVSELSGGERQRLFIVLALIPGPEVVFLDELTTGLDAKARRDVWRNLSKRKAQGLTIFLTSHFMDEVAALCDEICILKNGRSVFYGTVNDAILTSPFEKLEDAYLWYTKEEDPNFENI